MTRLHDKSDLVYATTDHSSSGFTVSMFVRKVYLRAGGDDSASSTDDSLKIIPLDVSKQFESWSNRLLTQEQRLCRRIA
jgi:hypothetical protein